MYVQNGHKVYTPVATLIDKRNDVNRKHHIAVMLKLASTVLNAYFDCC